MSSMNIDPKIVRDYVTAINEINSKVKNNFNDEAHEMVKKAKELRNYVFPFFSERNDILNFIDYSSGISNSLIDRMFTDFTKFTEDINKALEINNQFLKSETAAYNGLPTFPKEAGVNNIHILRKVMDEAKQKLDSISVGGLDAAKRKQAAWDEYAKAKKAYEDEFKRLRNIDTPTTLTKEAAKKVAQGIWLGTITKNGKLLFGDERRKYLEEKYGKDGAKMVQEELDKMAGTNTTQKPTTTQPRKVTSTSKPTPAKTTAKPVSTTKKPTTTTTSPKNTNSKAPQSTAKPTTQPSKTVAPTSKPTTSKPTTAPTTKPTKVPQQTTAPTVRPTTSPDPGGTPASQGVRSRLEDEIKRLREQLEKEQQERINLEQRVQQQQQQAAQQQRQQTVTNYTARPEAAQVVQPEQATVAPTSTPAPAVVIPGSTDSGSTGSGNTGTGGSGTGYDSPSLPNPNAGDSGSGSSSSSSSSSGGFNPIPLGIGLGAAVAGGIGVKAYVDHKKNGKFDDENEDSVTNGNRFWTDEDPNVVHSEEDMLGDDSGSQDVSYQAVENSNSGNDTWNIEENELPDDNSFDLLSENN